MKIHPSTATAIQRLERMNETALQWFCEGQIEEAKALLTSCLKICMQNRFINKDESACTTESHAVLMDLPLYDAVLPQDFVTDHDASFCLYPCAFGVYADSIQNVSTLTAVAAYNLALMHHETGLLDIDWKRLSQARTLYKLALATMPPSSSAAPWLLLAARNNLGHLACYFGDQEHIQSCFVAIQGLLQHIVTHNNSIMCANTSTCCGTSWDAWFAHSLSRANPAPLTFAPVA